MHLVALHPCHKLNYFKKAKWDNEWIDTARQIVQDEFKHSYKGSPAANLTTSTSHAEHNSESKKVCWILLISIGVLADSFIMKTTTIFDSLPVICTPKTTDLCDELDRYLSINPEHTVDVLLWWAKEKHLYLCLSCMALDYLSIPGMLCHFVILLFQC